MEFIKQCSTCDFNFSGKCGSSGNMIPDITQSCSDWEESQDYYAVMYQNAPWYIRNPYDFSYRSSEYKALEGKSFQILIVENTPEYIPFVSRKEGTGIEVDTIYIRRGTSNERANSQELDEMFRKHMQHIYPQTGEPLDLQEHLRQLKILYENIAPTIISYENSPLFESIGWLRNLPSKIWGEKKEEDNPLYPEESYEQFIANMIDKKKNKIERVLDLR